MYKKKQDFHEYISNHGTTGIIVRDDLIYNNTSFRLKLKSLLMMAS